MVVCDNSGSVLIVVCDDSGSVLMVVCDDGGECSNGCDAGGVF